MTLFCPPPQHTQGASYFVIYDDSSEDDPWSVLEKYAALGIVDFYDMRGHPDNSSQHLQLQLLNRCFADLRARREELDLHWAIFGDSDEYVLSSNPGQTLTELLNSKYRNSQCLHFQRTLYGSSFYVEPPKQGLVTETYVLAGKDHGQSHGKLIANLRSDNVTRLKNVHRFLDDQHVHCVPKEEVTDVRINHYLRSLRDYDVKVRTYFPREGYSTKDPPLQRFFERDQNEYHSPVAAAYACSVRGLIQDIQARWDNGSLTPVPRPKPWSETVDGLAYFGWLREKAQAKEERRKEGDPPHEDEKE